MKKGFLLLLIFMIGTICLPAESYGDFRNTDSHEEEKEEEADQTSLCITGLTAGTCLVITMPLLALYAGGYYSSLRVQSPDEVIPADNEVTLRYPGELFIPFIRYQQYYQFGETPFLNSRLEGGYGFLSLGAEAIFHENLSFSRGSLQLLYRMSVGNFLEIDLGFGVGTRDLTEEIYPVFSVPLKMDYGFNFLGEFNAQFAFTDSGTLCDAEVRLVYHLTYFSVEGGYRFFGDMENYTHGPFAGISLMY